MLMAVVEICRINTGIWVIVFELTSVARGRPQLIRGHNNSPRITSHSIESLSKKDVDVSLATKIRNRSDWVSIIGRGDFGDIPSS